MSAFELAILTIAAFALVTLNDGLARHDHLRRVALVAAPSSRTVKVGMGLESARVRVL